MKHIKVGVLGAGWAGTGHATAFSRLPGVSVTAVWSRTRERAETLVHQQNIDPMGVYDHWQDLIAHADVDVISLATPPTLRREPFLAALERGCHILVEKPISVGLADANAMVTAAAQSNVVTATCFNHRYTPTYQLVKQEIENGRIGKILDIRTEWRDRLLTGDFYETRPWARRLDVGDGELGEGMAHEFDKARFLTNCEFTQIVSRVVPFTPLHDDQLAIDGGASMHMAALSNGVLGIFRCTLTAGEAEWNVIINGEKGSLRSNLEQVVCQGADDVEPFTIPVPQHLQKPVGVDILQFAWNWLIEDFVSAVRHQDIDHKTVPHLPTLLDGLRSQEIIAAALRSEKERNWMEI